MDYTYFQIATENKCCYSWYMVIKIIVYTLTYMDFVGLIIIIQYIKC